MFNALRLLLESLGNCARELDAEILRVQVLLKDDSKIAHLLRLRTVARQLFEDISGVPHTRARWGILHCERVLARGHNPFACFNRMVLQVMAGKEPSAEIAAYRDDIGD